MSRTELYRIGDLPEEIGSTHNSWRSAMYVWNDIAKRYFGLAMFPMFEASKPNTPDNKAWAVWNAHVTQPLSEAEKIVLKTTLDKAVVSAENINRVIVAFEEYGAAHPESSIAEQGRIIAGAVWPEHSFLAFNQTSVCMFWGYVPTAEDADDYSAFYDPNTGTEHWELFDDAAAAADVLPEV